MPIANSTVGDASLKHNVRSVETWVLWKVWGAFRKNFERRLLPPVCQSVGMEKKSCFTQDGFSWNLIFVSLTHSMVQSPSWASNWFAATQEIPRISRNPKVHYRTHKRPPPVSILGQSNPVHILTSHLLEIHPNIIHPSTPRSPQWSLSLRFLHQDPIHSPLLNHTDICVLFENVLNRCH